MANKKIKIFFLTFLAIGVGLVWLFSFSRSENKPENSLGNLYPEPSKVFDATMVGRSGDIEPQKHLANFSQEIKAIYVTGSSAGDPKKIDNFIKLIKKADLSAMVIDIKDYTGYVFYDSGIDEVIEYKAEKIRIPKINTLIKKLHDENIYAIARIVVFQDPVLASARPELAVKNKFSGRAWKDNLNLAWIDPASEDSWRYIVKIAKNASDRGFDEINFDYIRFPSDGSLAAMSFPFYDQKGISKEESIREFFAYLRSNLKDIKISADIFGLTTSAEDDLGIGQVIENAYQNFDAVSPMVYPSHYANGFLGFPEPAKHPYEVVKYAIESASKKLAAYNVKEETLNSADKTKNNVKIRPWIQAFNMGDIYDVAKIKVQIKASDEAGGTGWMIWNPANNYYFLNNF